MPNDSFDTLVSVLADDCHLHPNMTLVRTPARLCSTLCFLASGVLGHVTFATIYRKWGSSGSSTYPLPLTPPFATMQYPSFPSFSSSFYPLLTHLLLKRSPVLGPWYPQDENTWQQIAFLDTFTAVWERECNYRRQQQHSPMPWSRRSRELLSQWQPKDLREDVCATLDKFLLRRPLTEITTRLHLCPDPALDWDPLDTPSGNANRVPLIFIHFYSQNSGHVVSADPFQEYVQVRPLPEWLYQGVTVLPFYVSIIPNETDTSSDLFKVQLTNRKDMGECQTFYLGLSIIHSLSCVSYISCSPGKAFRMHR